MAGDAQNDAVKVAISIGVPGGGGPPWRQAVDYVREAERLGVDQVWSAEAWGSDAVTPLAYLAAVTDTILLGSGIMQITARTPVTTAQTAMTLATVSDNRFLLGLGVSGPQVVEGLHGQRFDHPLGRLRETIEIIRLAMSGERIVHHGRHFELPLPGGEGKALRLGIGTEATIPLWLATLSPKMLELTGELADGWLGTSFVPEGAEEASIRHIRAGAERAGRTLADVELAQGGDVAFSDELDELIAERKKGLAFSLGGMGSATTNFYNDAYSRQGWAEVATTVRDLWVAGRRDEAVAAVPDEMVLQTTLLGTSDMVRDRIRAARAVGIDVLRVYPAGHTLDERIDTLARTVELVREVSAEA
jgi:F420-dependent oxidoreductase-like protein